MIDVRLSVTDFVASLRRLEAETSVTARQVLGQSVALALSRAKATTEFKDRTGELRKSLTRGQSGPWRLYLKAGAKHAVFIERGTKAHAIEARRAKALRFVGSGGGLVFRKRVWHPGTKPTHFMDDAARAGERFLEATLEASIAKALR